MEWSTNCLYMHRHTLHSDIWRFFPGVLVHHCNRGACGSNVISACQMPRIRWKAKMWKEKKKVFLHASWLSELLMKLLLVLLCGPWLSLTVKNLPDAAGAEWNLKHLVGHSCEANTKIEHLVYFITYKLYRQNAKLNLTDSLLSACTLYASRASGRKQTQHLFWWANKKQNFISSTKSVR